MSTLTGQAVDALLAVGPAVGPAGDFGPSSGEGSEGEFYPVSLEEMKAVLLPLGFAQINLAGTGEWVFSKMIKFEGLDTVLRIFTSIDKVTNVARPVGSDSIKVCLGRWDPKLIDPHTKKLGCTRLFKTLERVRRTRAWERNLRARLAEVPMLDALTAGLFVEVVVPVGVKVNPGITEAELVAAGVGGKAVPPSAQIEVESVAVDLSRIVRPTCPQCGAGTTHAKRGRAGLFFGCSRYPSCRGLVDAKRHAEKVVFAERGIK